MIAIAYARYPMMAKANLIFYEEWEEWASLTAQTSVNARPNPPGMAGDPLGERVTTLLGRFPEYRKTLALAIAHEESSAGSDNKGWQWHDVETHPTKLMRLVTEGIAVINETSRHASRYLLRDRKIVKEIILHSPS